MLFVFSCNVEQVLDLVRSELEAAGVKEEAKKKLLAGLQNAIHKAEKEKRVERENSPSCSPNCLEGPISASLEPKLTLAEKCTPCVRIIGLQVTSYLGPSLVRQTDTG